MESVSLVINKGRPKRLNVRSDNSLKSRIKDTQTNTHTIQGGDKNIRWFQLKTIIGWNVVQRPRHKEPDCVNV